MTLRSRVPALLAAACTLATASVTEAAWDQPHHRATVFLNFDGGLIEPGSANASLMQASCLQAEVEYPAFDRTELVKVAIIEGFEEALKPYGIRVTTTRPPPELPYTMVMFGGTSAVFGSDDPVLAKACNVDCGDSWWRDTIFVYTDNFANGNVLSKSGLYVFGNVVGLEHISGDDYIMKGISGVGSLGWASECVTLLNPVKCGYVHEEFCPPGRQNDHDELLAYFGENTPDVVAPTVEIVAPADGAVLAPGALEIEAAVSDDHEGFGWKLIVRRDDVVLAEAPAYKAETSWKLGLDAGVYEIEVAAIDHDRNVGRDVVTVYVGVPAPEPGGSSGGDDSGDDSGAPTSGAPTSGAPTSGATTEEPEGTRETGTGGPGGSGEDGKESPGGCACAAAPTSGGAGLFALVGLAGLVRRRRARA